MSNQVSRRVRFSRRPTTPGADRFGFLLLVLISAYLISAFTANTVTSVVQIVLFLAAMSLAVRNGPLGRRTARVALAIAVGGSVVAAVLAATHSTDASGGAANLWAALVLLLAVILIVRRVVVHPVVTVQSIYGAVSAYMIIGLMFAAIYSAMAKFGGGVFFASGQAGNLKTFQYFSFTTLTTLGYGDYTATESGGQAVAVMEALIGQVFLATLVARLVAAYRVPGTARHAARTRHRGRAGPAGRLRPARPRGGGPRLPSSGPRTRPGRPVATRISFPGHAPPARRSRPRPGR